jgi:phenylpropionate dioxygenase-like ring-hydroxylating dioxygenase large terminal subunit
MLAEEYSLLRRVWFPVARLADLGKGIASGNILGRDLVIYKAGPAVTVAAAACPHRGMALHMGQIIGSSLECPYHGWRFAAQTGECTVVPSLPPSSGPPRVSLQVYPSRIAYGLVWSCLGEPCVPFPDVIPGLDASWVVSAGRPYDLRCGLRQLTENFRDRAHFPFVHASTMGDLEKVVGPYRVVRDGWELSWRSSVKPEGGNSDELAAEEQFLDYRLLLPMYASIRVRGSAGTRVISQLVTPIAADGTRVRQYWLVGIDADMASRGVDIDSLMSYEQHIFEEDHAIVENQTPTEAPLELDSQAHTAADRFSIVYRRTYAEFIESWADKVERA